MPCKAPLLWEEEVSCQALPVNKPSTVGAGSSFFLQEKSATNDVIVKKKTNAFNAFALRFGLERVGWGVVGGRGGGGGFRRFSAPLRSIFAAVFLFELAIRLCAISVVVWLNNNAKLILSWRQTILR